MSRCARPCLRPTLNPHDAASDHFFARAITSLCFYRFSSNKVYMKVYISHIISFLSIIMEVLYRRREHGRRFKGSNSETAKFYRQRICLCSNRTPRYNTSMVSLKCKIISLLRPNGSSLPCYIGSFVFPLPSKKKRSQFIHFHLGEVNS